MTTVCWCDPCITKYPLVFWVFHRWAKCSFCGKENQPCCSQRMNRKTFRAILRLKGWQKVPHY